MTHNSSITRAIRRGAAAAGRAAHDHRDEIAAAAVGAAKYGAAEDQGFVGWLEANQRPVWIGLAVLLVLFLAYHFFLAPRRKVAHDLADAGWKLYTSDDCGYCRDQMEILGMFRYPNQTVCSDKANNCPSVYAFPTWEARDGRRVLGVQSEEDLKRMAAMYK